MENSLTSEKRGLSADAVKLIAAAAMLIDHISECFGTRGSFMWTVMHCVGRITAPVMCFFIAEGFHYTKNVKKYLLRLGIFAVISWFPYVFMGFGRLPVYFEGGNVLLIFRQSIMYTFFLGLLELVIIHSEWLKIPLKLLLTAGIVYLSFLGDWSFAAILFILVFDRFRGNFRWQALAFTVAVGFEYLVLITLYRNPPMDVLFQLGAIFALIPLYFYNGKRGKSGQKNRQLVKWFFYVFYPLHMLVLGILRNVL